MKKDQVHTIELFYHRKNKVTVYNGGYESEQMTRIINDLQRLCWTLGDYESDEDLIPVILLDNTELVIELNDITEQDLHSALMKIHGVDDE